MAMGKSVNRSTDAAIAMSPGIIMLLLLLGSVAVATAAVLLLFRCYANVFGLREVLKDGVILTEKGIEYLGFLWLVKLEGKYDEVELVDKSCRKIELNALHTPNNHYQEVIQKRHNVSPLKTIMGKGLDTMAQAKSGWLVI